MTLLRLALLLCLASCATQNGVEGSRPAKAPPSTSREECLFMSVVADWATVDEQRFLIYGPGRRNVYLAQLTLPTPDLRYGLQLKLIDGDRNGRICGFGSDAVEFDNAVFPGRILIRSLQQIDAAEAAVLLATAKSKSKSKSKPVPAAAPARE
jgi:Family of unknown function (DUF6491)